MKQYLTMFICFILMRTLTSIYYSDAYYYYGMIASQFAIAEGAYKGYNFAQDTQLSGIVESEANKTNKFIPLEEWKNYKGSGVYATFPSVDLPGYGYIIALTSKYFADELTTKYAYAFQVLVELVSVLIFAYCCSFAFGNRIALLSGLLYVFAYPFIWPIASLPMRDIFVIGVYSFYLLAFTIWLNHKAKARYIYVVSAIIISSLLLWIRPSGYYFFFAILPLIYFVKQNSIKERFTMMLLTAMIPFIVFGYTLKQFNVRYYGMEDTGFVGRGLWEGMGIIKDNPYGFTLNDSALVPWVKARGYDVEYASPKMNEILGDYAIKVVKADPGYYLKTVARRIIHIARSPLEIYYNNYSSDVDTYKDNLKSFVSYIINHPVEFVMLQYGRVFFYSGILLSLYMLSRSKKKIIIIMLLMPFLYTLATQIPLHFAPRYLSTGAWVMVLPMAWFIDRLCVNNNSGTNMRRWKINVRNSRSVSS